MTPMKLIKVIVAVSVIVSLVIFIRATDYKEVIISIKKVGYNFIILILTTGVAYIFGTLSWKYSMGKHLADISLRRLFQVRHAGETISLLNPMGIVGGEAAKVQLLGSYIRNKKAIVASILVSRAIMIISQLFLFFLTATILFIQGVKMDTINLNAEKWVLPIGIVVVLVIIMLVVGVTYKTRLTGMIRTTKQGRQLAFKTGALRLKLKEIYAETIKLCRYSRKAVILAVVFALLHWIAGAFEFYFILHFLGVKISIQQALLIDMGVIFFKAAGAFIPGQIGIEELGNKMMLSVIGVHEAGIWISASILRRSRQLVWIAFGACIYFFLDKNRLSTSQEPNGSTFCKS